ncbi:MAG: glycosyltransferase [Thermogutta sp.]
MQPIVQVLHSLECGGAERLALRLAQGLLPNYRTTFICLDARGPLATEAEQSSFDVHVLYRRAGLDWSCQRRLRHLLRQIPPAVVLAHQYTPFFYSSLARGLCSSPPIIFVEHGRHVPDPWKPHRIFANRLLLRRSDIVIAVADSVKRAVISKEGIASKRILVIPNGIDPAPYFAAAANREAIRRQLGLADNDVAIIQVARLDPLKDHDTAITAVEQLAHDRVRLLIVGDGPEETRIRHRVKQSAIRERFRLLGYRRDIPNLLAAADIFLLSSVSEGLPVTILEAMAAALPIVATDVGDVSKAVADGTTGFLVPPRHPEALAKALERLCASPQLRRQFGQAGRDLLMAQFTEKMMHTAYRKLIEDVLQGIPIRQKVDAEGDNGVQA